MNELTPEDFWSILHSAPESKSVFYRLYYNPDGTPLMYSMEELPHHYVEIDSKTFWDADMKVRIVDGKLIFKRPVITVNKLVPSSLAGTACSPNDVCVVVPEDQPNRRWAITSNEIN